VVSRRAREALTALKIAWRERPDIDQSSLYLHESKQDKLTSLIDIVFGGRHLFPIEHVTPSGFLGHITTTLRHNYQFMARKVIFLDSFGYHSLRITT
jgi:hypothetical protein